MLKRLLFVPIILIMIFGVFGCAATQSVLKFHQPISFIKILKTTPKTAMIPPIIAKMDLDDFFAIVFTNLIIPNM